VGMEAEHVAVKVSKGESRGKIWCTKYVKREREEPLGLPKGCERGKSQPLGGRPKGVDDSVRSVSNGVLIAERGEWS